MEPNAESAEAAKEKTEYAKRTRREQWQAMFTTMVQQAADEGFEVTVESVPLKPLAMRNKKSVVTITDKR